MHPGPRPSATASCDPSPIRRATSRALRGARAAATVLLALAAAGCDGKLPDALEVQTHAQQLRTRVAQMRTEGFLLGEDVRTTPVGARELFGRLDRIDANLDAAGLSKGTAPTWWDLSTADGLATRLRPFDEFFREVDELLATPMNKRALERDVPLAYRTTIRSGETNYDEFATPPITRVQRWVDLLSARAVHATHSGIEPGNAAKSLAQAFDLLHLLDDGSMDGTRVSAALEKRVLLALRLIGTNPNVDPIQLAEVLEPRIARIGDKKRLWETLKAEVSRRVEITLALLSEPGRDDKDHWLDELDSSYTALAKRGLDVIWLQDELRNASTVCVRVAQFPEEHPFRSILDGVQELHDLGTGCYVARIALVAARHQAIDGEWPRYLSDLTPEFLDAKMPYLACRNLRLEYQREFLETKIAVEGRYGDDPSKTEVDPLTEWTWRNQVSQQSGEDRSR